MSDTPKNFAYSTVATVTNQNTIVLQSGDGALFGYPNNVTIWPVGKQPLASNASIRRITGISGDTLTLDPATQESSTLRTISVGDQVALTVTAKTVTDIQNAGILTVAPSGVSAQYNTDGVADQVEIQAAISALPVAGGTVQLREGTYNLTSPISVPSNVRLTGCGHATILNLTNNARTDLVKNSDWTNGNTNIILENFTIEGNKLNQTPGISLNGVHFQKVTNFVIRGVWSKNIGTSDVSDIAEGFAFSNSCTQGSVTNCIAESNNHYGFNCYNASYVTFAGNVSVNNGRHGFGCSNGSNHMTWTGNTCKNNALEGFWVRNTSESTICGNTIYMPASSTCGIQLKGNSSEDANLVSDQRNSVFGNVISGACQYGIYIQNHSNYNTIANNTVKGSANYGIYMVSTEYNTVTGNVVTEVTQQGIYADGSGFTISNNLVKQCGLDGILINCNDGIVSSNMCVDNSQTSAGTYNGITISGRQRNTVSNNRCFDTQTPKTQGYGIAEINATNYNTIMGNQVQNNLTGGVSLIGSSTEIGHNIN